MIYFSLIILGLALGSFINALVWRLRQQSLTGRSRERQVKREQYSILIGRSMCVNCRHTLAWYDLLPVLSWMSLRGKCRYCKRPISWQYPIVELLTAGLFTGSYVFWPSELSGSEFIVFGGWLVLLTGLMALAVYDLRWMLLPNKIIHPLIVIAGLIVPLNTVISGSGIAAITGALLGGLTLGGIFYTLFQVSAGRWIGGGDVKLGLLLGVIADGPMEALLILFLASLTGSIIGVALMATKSIKSGARLPFGPFLIFAAITTRLFGAALIDWYLTQFSVF